MNKERLLKLAEELERCSRGHVLTVPNDGKLSFDMNTVMRKLEDHEPLYTTEFRGCGAAACAMGFAGLHPWFRKRGLKYNEATGAFGVEGLDYDEAATRFFDLPNTVAADNLFLPLVVDGAVVKETPKQVAKRIRKFVAEHA